MKLTANQLATLRLIEAGEVYQRNCGHAAWRIWGASPTVVGRVVSLGLAMWDRFGGERVECSLTDAGRAALSASPSPHQPGRSNSGPAAGDTEGSTTT